MYDNILVPLDGSDRARRILPYVEDIALVRKSTLILLQVVSSASFSGAVQENDIQARLEDFRQRREQADRYLSGLQGEFREKGIRTVKRVESGSVVETILSVAEREGADLVAMASHGRGGLSRVFYGSVAAGVLNRIDRPLLLVRSRNR